MTFIIIIVMMIQEDASAMGQTWKTALRCLVWQSFHHGPLSPEKCNFHATSNLPRAPPPLLSSRQPDHEGQEVFLSTMMVRDKRGLTTREEPAGDCPSSPVLSRMDRSVHTLLSSISEWPKLKDSGGRQHTAYGIRHTQGTSPGWTQGCGCRMERVQRRQPRYDTAATEPGEMIRCGERADRTHRWMQPR